MRRRVFQSSREAVARKRKRQRAYKVARLDAGRHGLHCLDREERRPNRRRH